MEELSFWRRRIADAIGAALLAVCVGFMFATHGSGPAWAIVAGLCAGAFWMLGDLDERAWDLWAYIDGRDAGQAIAKAVTHDTRGFGAYLIVADDTVMPIPTEQIIAQRHPDIPRNGELAEFGTLLSNERARTELGFTAQHLWRDHVS